MLNYIEFFENGYGLSVTTMKNWVETEYSEAVLDVAIIKKHVNAETFEILDCYTQLNLKELNNLFLEVSTPDYFYCSCYCNCKDKYRSDDEICTAHNMEDR